MNVATAVRGRGRARGRSLLSLDSLRVRIRRKKCPNRRHKFVTLRLASAESNSHFEEVLVSSLLCPILEMKLT